MAQSYLYGGDFAKGIIAKTGRQSCHKPNSTLLRNNFDFISYSILPDLKLNNYENCHSQF
jgi:hypothetical protein